MSNIKNLPTDIIGNIIDYMPGPTSTILERDIIVNDIRLHYNTTKLYKNHFKIFALRFLDKKNH